MTIQIDMNIDMPNHISDETAAVIVDFLYALGDAVGNRYYGQIRRYYEDLRELPPPPRTTGNSHSSPSSTSPSEKRSRRGSHRSLVPLPLP